MKKFFLVLFFAETICVNAQDKRDTSFIGQFEKKNNIQLNLWNTDLDFGINPRMSIKNYKVDLSPNVAYQTGVSLGLKWVTLFVGFQIPGTTSDPIVFGKTNYYDFSFSYFKKQFGGEIFYRNYEGLFQNPNDTAPLTVRKDAHLVNFGLSFYYVLNSKKFSYRSALAQLELQKKSAGSVVILANIHFRSVTADSSFIPKAIDSYQNFSTLQGISDMRFFTLNIRPGYAHNFTFKNGLWFISPSVFAGGGIGNYQYRGISGMKNGTDYDLDFRAIISCGINHKNWFANIFFIYDSNLNYFDNNLVSLQTTSVGLNIAYRLRSIFGRTWL